MTWIITLLFFCSGATALVYEVVWSKYLALMFGSTISAQTVVLAVFMGGLALGNALFGRRADASGKPIFIYGCIEVVIGVYALLFHLLHGTADKLFTQFGSSLLEQPAALLGLKGLLSVALLLPPTVLMGGTLPMVAAWLQKSAADSRRNSARFYAINTLGAVLGAWLAGFILVRKFGMPTTLQIVAFINLAIGVVAIVLARRAQPVAKAAKVERVEAVAAAVQRSEHFNSNTIAAVVVFMTGAISMGLEVLASRSLSMVFGGSLEAFSVMLIAFILGIGAGGWVIASVRKEKFVSPATITFLLMGAAVALAVFLVTAEQWALFYVNTRNGFEGDKKYLWHQITSAGISIVALGVPAALIGAILPLWIRLVPDSESRLGSHVGRLLTWNTIGAVAGSLVTGFFLMPLAGLRLSFGVMGALLCLTALLVAWKAKVANGIPAALASAVMLVVLSAVGAEDWQYAFSSGIFREREKELPSDYFAKIKERDKLLFYRDGADATIAVVTDRQTQQDTELVLAINGKPDGSTLGDLSTEYLLAHLPMLMRPQSKDIFVLGFGTGITPGALLGHPVSSITIAENCGPVLEAAKSFERWNRGVMTNQLTKLYREDARTVLKLSPKKYDVIISEPSNPWTAAIGSVFSREFYELAASRLNEGGIMSQWFHMYEMNDEIVSLVLRTFHSVFPNFEVWETRNGDLILLGSKTPWECSPRVFKEVFNRDQPAKDLAEIGIKKPETVWARQVASQATSFALIEDGSVQSDFRPILEYEAPKAFYKGDYAARLFLYDERMLQGTFAAKEKRDALAALDDSGLVAVFEKYGSANPMLMRYLSWRAEIVSFSSLFSRAKEVYAPDPFLEFIFRRAETYPTEATIPPNASADYGIFLRAQALVYDAIKWREGADKIETLLRSYDPQRFEDGKMNPDPGSFAAIVARARFRNGDREGAAKAVQLGLQLVPDDMHLLYLKRLLIK